MKSGQIKLPIYLDYNATTPVDPAVAAAMMPFLSEQFGNPSSLHPYGLFAADAVKKARAQVANLLGSLPDEICFTSCASESINTAIKGVAFAKRPMGGHLITSVVEHPATIATCRYLEAEFGFGLTLLAVNREGRVDPSDLAKSIRAETVLISLIMAQNETGVLQPIQEIGAIAHERRVLFHVDASQAVGKMPVKVSKLGCDLLTLAGHKLYAPKGVGALYVRQGVKLHPLIHGAGYEGGLRGGTANVPYMVALGQACDIAAQGLDAGEPERIRELRDRLHRRLAAAIPELRLNGHTTERLPNTLNISVPGLTGQDLLAAAPEVAASTGSACHAGVNHPSEVLLAMGIEPQVAMGTLRLSLGRWSTEAEIDYGAESLIQAVKKISG